MTNIHLLKGHQLPKSGITCQEILYSLICAYCVNNSEHTVMYLMFPLVVMCSHTLPLSLLAYSSVPLLLKHLMHTLYQLLSQSTSHCSIALSTVTSQNIFPELMREAVSYCCHLVTHNNHDVEISQKCTVAIPQLMGSEKLTQ